MRYLRLSDVTRRGDGTYKYGCVFVGMSDTDALKIDIYQIFNDV